MSHYNPYTLKNKTVLITGASSGIGRATAIECSKLGANVIITGRDEQRLADTLAQLSGDGHRMVACDLAENDNIDALVDALPNIDCLVNNAGFTKRKPIQFIQPGDFQAILQVDLMAPIMLLKKLLRLKRLNDGASLVFTSSLAGIGRTSVGNGMYTAAKGGISAFVRSAAKELAGKGMRVNAVCPAMVDTAILDSEERSEQEVAADKQRYPMGRYATPAEVALAIVYLLSDASSYTTGVNLPIDGGLTL